MTFRRHLAARLRTLAASLDPPPAARGDELEAADRLAELMDHVSAGRIPRRRDETRAAFHRRVIAGDFEIVDNLIDFNTERARRAHRKAASE